VKPGVHLWIILPTRGFSLSQRERGGVREPVEEIPLTLSLSQRERGLQQST